MINKLKVDRYFNRRRL